jgi:hypothetical protein
MIEKQVREPERDRMAESGQSLQWSETRAPQKFVMD